MKIPFVVAVLCMTLSRSTAAPSPIGTLETPGSFRVNEATLTGNATLFEGDIIETGLARSRLDLASRTRISLLPRSRGRVFRDHMVLEKGMGEIGPVAGFEIEALGLSIHPESGKTSARVALSTDSRVRVAALTGSLRVTNRRGLLIATLAPGVTLEFEPPASPQNGAETSKMTGCLRATDGHFTLSDETTNVVAELEGRALAAESGNRVEITGVTDIAAIPVRGTTQVIQVSQVRRLSRGCAADAKAPAAAAAGGTTKTGGGGGGLGGISTAAVAIIGGVAVAAVVGGLAVADALPGQQAATVSR